MDAFTYTIPSNQELFKGDNGDLDEIRIRVYRDAGYRGPILRDASGKMIELSWDYIQRTRGQWDKKTRRD
jgi:hypothetical protein